jgi:hypothetical protein
MTNLGSPANEIILEQVGSGDTKISIEDSEWGLPLYENRLFVIDTSILFPTILPRHRRNANTLFDFSQIIQRKHSKYSTNKKRSINYYKRRQINHYDTCIELVNLLEEGKLKQKGMYFVITDAVFQELRTHEGRLGENNVRDWISSINNYCYRLSFDIPLMRSRYKPISKMFDEIGDFSLAITSYILGVSVVTGDYRSFDTPTIKRYKEMFDNRWKNRRCYEHHDAVSFLMKLKDHIPNFEISKMDIQVSQRTRVD